MKRLSKILVLILVLSMVFTLFTSCGKAPNDMTAEEAFNKISGDWEMTYYFISGALTITTKDEFVEKNGYYLGIRFDSETEGSLLLIPEDGDKAEVPFTWKNEKGPTENVMLINIFDVEENAEDDFYPENDCFSLKVEENVILWEDDTTAYFFEKK